MFNRRRQSSNLAGDEKDPLLDNQLEREQTINNNHASPNQYVMAHSQNQPRWIQQSASLPLNSDVQPVHIETWNQTNTQPRYMQPVASRSPSNSHFSESIDLNYGYELHRLRGNHSSAIDLDAIKNGKNQPIIDYVFYTVQDGDTLLNLSVKYSCDIASIKRLNNLWTDQDLHALTRLKLPVGRFRLIEDDIREENTKAYTPDEHTISTKHPHSNLTSSSHATATLFTNHSNTNNYSSYIPNRTTSISQNSRGSDSIFKDLDLNIERARTAARSYNDHASEIMQTLAQNGNIVDDNNISDPSRLARQEAETLLNDLSDFGLTYNGLLLFIFIVCLICPLAYFIYLEETHLSHDANKAS